MLQLKGYVQQQERIADKTEEINNQKKIAEQDTKCKSLSKNKGKENKKKAGVVENEPKVQVQQQKQRSFVGQAVLAFCEFFKSLQTVDSEGRIIVEKKVIKFLLLNTSDHFEELKNSARYKPVITIFVLN